MARRRSPRSSSNEACSICSSPTNNMPRMTGLELVRRLRDAAFSGKILVLSAHLSAENRAAYDALGVDGMIPKPFDLHQLRALIRQIAEERAAISRSEEHTSELQSPQNLVCRLLLGKKELNNAHQRRPCTPDREAGGVARGRTGSPAEHIAPCLLTSSSPTGILAPNRFFFQK